MAQSELEATFTLAWRTLAGSHLPEPVAEFKFHPDRRWRFDFAFVDEKVAVECEGGVYRNGRHNRAKGFIDDCEKYNAAAILGWRVLRYPSPAFNDPHFIVQQVKAALEATA